jgi:hypothetical protein
MNRTAVGVDIAKNVFQLHYIDPATPPASDYLSCYLILIDMVRGR